MIDLHCHMLPGIDDGAPDLAEALAMARIAVEDGITVTACTPHIYPGLYENDAAGIRSAIGSLQRVLDAKEIPLKLVQGADVHLAPDMLERLRKGSIPTLNGSRYFLFEPPHHVAPPRMESMVFDLLAAGYVPIVTHPERLSWIDTHYSIFPEMVKSGAWMQLTAGSITGRFGGRAKYWSERMLDEGIVHIVATDAHSSRKRPPFLAEAREAVAKRLGIKAADEMVQSRPRAVIDNEAPESVPLGNAPIPVAAPSMWKRLIGLR